jgi:hypothetical protein
MRQRVLQRIAAVLVLVLSVGTLLEAQPVDTIVYVTKDRRDTPPR